MPGAEPRINKEGFGRVMRSGPREVMFNMHFNKPTGPGTAVCTNIQAGIRFKPKCEVIRFVRGSEGLLLRPLEIPDGASIFSASKEYTFE